MLCARIYTIRSSTACMVGSYDAERYGRNGPFGAVFWAGSLLALKAGGRAIVAQTGLGETNY
ncbi:hypothetical protein Misp04_55810 [Micromonospora sp. NBRC 101691]|nr:hypothetical protein Misp04_55810 [Micromonospora sp. NBRC 101691]